MTLQSDFQVRCKDLLDTYRYDLLNRGEVIVTKESEDLFRYGIVTRVNGSVFLDLCETHSEVLNRADIDDPNTYILTIT